MSNIDAVKKVMMYQKDKSGFVKEPTVKEMADLVVLVLNSVKQIQDTIQSTLESQKNDISKKLSTPVEESLIRHKNESASLLDQVTKEVNSLISQSTATVSQLKNDIETQVEKSISNIKNGDNGIVTEAEIQRAAEVALSMLELPDFDSLVTESITSNGDSIRNALELLSGEDRYKVEISDVQGLSDSLTQLYALRTANGGTIGKQQVYGFIRQAIADGTISAGGGISDGDKGDITVSSSGTVWTLDDDTVGTDELSATGTPSSSTFLRGDNTWATPAGSGDVSKVGTPVNNQVGVWTGDGTIEGDADLTFDTATNTLNVAPVGLDGRLVTHAVKSDASDGLLIEANNGTDVGALGVGNTANVAWEGAHNFALSTQDTIAGFTGVGKTLGSLATATYPSLTELSYVKGVTSSVQTQISARLPLAGGTMTGNINLGENTSVALDPAGSADGKYSGLTVAGIAGYAQAFGDLVYLDPTDSRWEAVDINAAAGADGDARGIIGMVVVAGTDGAACTILLNGIIRADTNFPALTINTPVYAAETAGDIVVTQPTTTDAVIRIVGFAITADEIYLNPSNDYTTHI